MDLNIRKIRHGANPPNINVGGDIDLAHSKDDPDFITFLEGDIEKTLSLNMLFSYQMKRNLFIDAELIYTKIDHHRNFEDQFIKLNVNGVFLGISLNK